MQRCQTWEEEKQRREKKKEGKKNWSSKKTHTKSRFHTFSSPNPMRENKKRERKTKRRQNKTSALRSRFPKKNNSSLLNRSSFLDYAYFCIFVFLFIFIFSLLPAIDSDERGNGGWVCRIVILPEEISKKSKLWTIQQKNGTKKNRSKTTTIG